MMNINRHNYEEHFILYLDNELSDAERRMVEDFAEKNPDLKEELDILLQSKLVPNQNIVFAGKNELFKYSESSVITSENYEELLLLYIDNELTPELRSEVEKFIETSPQAKQELAVLQKTKLQSETISFPDKGSLYRRTEKVRIVQLRWWRIAAAAVILLAIGLTTVVLMNNNTPGSTNPGNGFVETKQIQSTESSVAKTNDKIDLNSKKESIIKTDETILLPGKNITKADDKKIKNELPVEDQNVIANNNQKESNSLPVQEFERSVNIDAVTNVSKNEKTLPIQDNPQFAVTNNTDKPYIMTNGPINPNEFDEGKNKLRGFFRKATRFVERTTNISATDDDERLLIGGFAVKLK